MKYKMLAMFAGIVLVPLATAVSWPRSERPGDAVPTQMLGEAGTLGTGLGGITGEGGMTGTGGTTGSGGSTGEGGGSGAPGMPSGLSGTVYNGPTS
jgi:uncharacterized membrane protein YgcG